MAPRRVRSQHFATRRDFEAFCDRFTCFAAGDRLGHEARNIMVEAIVDNRLLQRALSVKM